MAHIEHIRFGLTYLLRVRGTSYLKVDRMFHVLTFIWDRKQHIEISTLPSMQRDHLCGKVHSGQEVFMLPLR